MVSLLFSRARGRKICCRVSTLWAAGEMVEDETMTQSARRFRDVVAPHLSIAQPAECSPRSDGETQNNCFSLTSGSWVITTTLVEAAAHGMLPSQCAPWFACKFRCASVSFAGLRGVPERGDAAGSPTDGERSTVHDSLRGRPPRRRIRHVNVRMCICLKGRNEATREPRRETRSVSATARGC